MRIWQVSAVGRHVTGDAEQRGQSLDILPVHHDDGHHGEVSQDPRSQISPSGRPDSGPGETVFDRRLQQGSRHLHLHLVHQSRWSWHQPNCRQRCHPSRSGL